MISLAMMALLVERVGYLSMVPGLGYPTGSVAPARTGRAADSSVRR